MGKYRAQFTVNGQPVQLTVRANDMEAALRQLKRDNPGASGFTVWNPEHYPPTDSEGSASHV